MGERVCLRCDWTAETEGAACPRCEAPLYRFPEPTTPREVTPAPHMQPHRADDRMHSTTIEAAQDDESVQPAEPVVASSRRWAVIVGALAVAAVWIVASGGAFGRLQTPAVPEGAQTSLAETGPAETETGPAETGPTVTGSIYPEQMSYVLPPEGGIAQRSGARKARRDQGRHHQRVRGRADDLDSGRFDRLARATPHT